MRKTLSSIGSSLGIIIDKPILEALGIGKTTILDLSIEDGALVVRPEPRRAVTARGDLEEWARSLLVRLSASPDDDFDNEISRFEETLPVFVKPTDVMSLRAPDRAERRAWMQQVVQSLLAQRPPPPRPIITRQAALAVLEELAAARGTFKEVTAARPFAGASPDVVASVLWFLIAHGHVEVHSDSRTIRPVLDRFRLHGRVPDAAPDAITDALKNGVTLLRLTPRGGDYLHELRTTERDDPARIT